MANIVPHSFKSWNYFQEHTILQLDGDSFKLCFVHSIWFTLRSTSATVLLGVANEVSSGGGSGYTTGR